MASCCALDEGATHLIRGAETPGGRGGLDIESCRFVGEGCEVDERFESELPRTKRKSGWERAIEPRADEPLPGNPGPVPSRTASELHLKCRSGGNVGEDAAA